MQDHSLSIPVTVELHGRTEYAAAMELQASLLQRLREGEAVDTLQLMEHPHTITIGRSGSVRDVTTPVPELVGQGVLVTEADRGGEVTYHGPGQLMIYPVLRLLPLRNDVMLYVRQLQSLLIEVLDRLSISAHPGDRTGVWVENRKIASIGIKVTRLPGQGTLVTSHGAALYRDADLAMFSHIVPCGDASTIITSIREEIGAAPPDEDLRELVIKAWETHFPLHPLR